MKTKQVIFAALLAAVCCVPCTRGSDFRILRDSQGQSIGTIEHNGSSVILRDSSGKLVWWQSEQPPENNPALDLRPEEKKESNLIFDLLKLPIVTVGIVLGLSIALIKAVAGANL